MATARKSKVIVTGITTDQFIESLACYARNDAKIQSITAKMDAEMTKIREKYQDELESLNKDKETAFEVVQTYAIERKDELFAKKKSMDTTHGVVGFRTGTPKLKLLPKLTWVRVLENVKIYLPDYVRTIEEVAKDRLLVDRNTAVVGENLHKVGIAVDQDERFFIDLKKEEVL